MFPSTLDILFALGNDAAAQLLIPDLDQYHYATNLAAMRYLADSYKSDFWESSIYNMWLNSIRALNPPESRDHLPQFMQTGAWWQQKMNTQLAAWTQLRHDNLLYAKPSYTGWGSCTYPYGYVEPFPEFYTRLNFLAKRAGNFFSEFDFSYSNFKESLIEYFSILEGVTDTLGSIANKELNNQPLSQNEISFMRGMIYHEPDYVGGWVDGWLPALLFGKYDIYQAGNITFPDYLVVDYHTTPSDCGGNQRGWVSHVGTGNANMAIVTAKSDNGNIMAFAGPVASYHEYTTTNFSRLTDEEWGETHLAKSLRPDWVNLYLADTSGSALSSGAVLLTDISGKYDILPTTEIMTSNFPNPFNSSTIIRFNIPRQLSYSKAVITIYNIQGKVIKRLLDNNLPSGVYLSKWDGKDALGRIVASGVYFYVVKVGNLRHAGKMHLIK